ncbi:putative transporter B0285.6 [Rhipicephalus microplus]|uniref:putative transporter B0285.6 n=1 Tax=Rhipicephalus microplus TaxID=6941 RepID=UPI003F6C8A5B
MTGVKWAIVTLPGVVLALVICSTAIWLLYIRPHEPAPQSVENLAVIRAAQQKHTGRRTHRGIRYACAAYAAIFSFVYALSVVVGLTERMALLTAMTSMMLATSLLTSFLQAAFDFVRHIWQMMPWGVLLLLGATHVASELLRAYDFLQKALASTSFWEQRTPLEAQTVLAFATSVMAEAADKRVLVEIMTPAVTRIAEAQRVYPAYYAIPMIVGASSNFIMPASMPLALLHEMARVQFWRLFMLGLFAKIVVVAMVIVTVNAADRAGLLAAQTPPE